MGCSVAHWQVSTETWALRGNAEHVLALNGAKVCPGSAQTPGPAQLCSVSAPAPHQQNVTVNVHRGSCLQPQNHGGLGELFKMV